MLGLKSIKSNVPYQRSLSAYLGLGLLSFFFFCFFSNIKYSEMLKDQTSIHWTHVRKPRCLPEQGPRTGRGRVGVGGEARSTIDFLT